MKITLSAVRRDETLAVHRQGAVLTVNGAVFDFSRMKDGDTLPASAVASLWFADNTDIDCVDGELELTMILPYPEVHNPAQAFPVPLLDIPNGPVQFPEGPEPLPAEANPPQASQGVIEWGQLVTKEMKDAQAAAILRANAVAAIAERRSIADTAIAPLQYAVELDDATEQEAAKLKAWKKYVLDLSRVPGQKGYPASIDWPTQPSEV